jgi:hypothetical protein
MLVFWPTRTDSNLACGSKCVAHSNSSVSESPRATRVKGNMIFGKYCLPYRNIPHLK